MLKLSYNKISNASVLAAGQTGGCINLQRLELQGNKINDLKNLPEGLPSLEVIYL
jgi:Leucine-rich repeat (LRR) protein